MIAFRDFEPKMASGGFFKSVADHASAFDAALLAANEWIDRDAIDVLNIETVGPRASHVLLRTIRIWDPARP